MPAFHKYVAFVILTKLMKKSAKQPLSNQQLTEFLSTIVGDATFINKLKIKYRPYVCPFDELIDYAQDKKSVYDVGCGSGQFCALIAKFSDVQKIKGIEIDKGLVANAEEINAEAAKSKSIKFAYFDGTTIPGDIADYDLIYMVDVYHHIPISIRDKFLKQLYEKMRVGAQLMFKDIDGASPFVACNKVHDMIFAQELSREIGHKKAERLLELIGFKIKESRKKRIFVYPHYFILAEK